MDRDLIYAALYQHTFKGRVKNHPRWRGVKILKFPADLLLYAQVIFQNKPDFIIETGTKFGGSALFFADMLELVGKGRVISIDLRPEQQPEHPRVTYITGPSTDDGVLAQVRELVKGGTVMASLDSAHDRVHVKRELAFYSGMVTSGQYLVVEDCFGAAARLYGPGEAVDWFFSKSRKFIREDLTEQFGHGITRAGWLKKL